MQESRARIQHRVLQEDSEAVSEIDPSCQAPTSCLIAFHGPAKCLESPLYLIGLCSGYFHQITRNRTRSKAKRIFITFEYFRDLPDYEFGWRIPAVMFNVIQILRRDCLAIFFLKFAGKLFLAHTLRFSGFREDGSECLHRLSQYYYPLI